MNYKVLYEDRSGYAGEWTLTTSDEWCFDKTHDTPITNKEMKYYLSQLEEIKKIHNFKM